jgi:pyruvate carboxylase
MDADTGAFYFIEVNPRVQVEHTVTEEVTGIDIVKAQIHIAEGAPIGDAGSGVPAQDEIKLDGHALQCRITTEDPEQNFIPDYGRITAYRGATGFGIRLDGGTAYSGAVITRFYDPLWKRSPPGRRRPEAARKRMDRALREFRIRGVATNLTFLENIIGHPSFLAGRPTPPASSTRRRRCSSRSSAGPGDQAADLHRRRHRQRPSGNQGPGRPKPPADAGRAGSPPAFGADPGSGTASSSTKLGRKASPTG